jgi:peptide-methionine (S)-S-oxide reductase
MPDSSAPTSKKSNLLWVLLIAGIVVAAVGAFVTLSNLKGNQKHMNELDISRREHLQKATFGGGCFWCTEAVYQQLKGVEAVISGYSGGHVKDPTYEEVCSKTSGHAEVVQIYYDPGVVSYEELLEVFWKTHDPTTPNQQGADKGPQYRSVVFYHNEEQKRLAEYYKKKLDESGVFTSKIVTEISPFTEFYPAEKYHQNYYESNPQAGYCAFVIRPKLDKFRKVFQDKLK